jgi:alpha-galactosidase
MSPSKEAVPGHLAHTRSADEPRVLPGRAGRPIKVVMLGAGSGFTPPLMNDLLSIPGLQGGEIGLCDIDESRLAAIARVIEMLIEQLGLEELWRVSASSRRRDLLADADYLINCIDVSGLDCVRLENEIPARFGVDQCIGDTVGPGGLFKGLRTIPVWLEILRDCEDLCPDAIVLNYTNPMSMLCLAAARSSPMQVVGLCHSVQGTSEMLAKRVGLPLAQIEWECAGINHLAWFTKFRGAGRDLYPDLIEKARADFDGTTSAVDDIEGPDWVRKDVMLHFGAFVTESSGHLSEYLPYYRKNNDALKRYCAEAFHGGSGFYAQMWPTLRKFIDDQREAMLRGETPIVRERSWEYASWIIEAREKDAPHRIHGNVPNCSRGAGPMIQNLPHDGIVEVACMVDRNGVQPVRYGRLPTQMAALCASHMYMVELAAQAAMQHSIETAIQALMLDPLTAAVCTPAQIREMALELFEAEREFLAGFA